MVPGMLLALALALPGASPLPGQAPNETASQAGEHVAAIRIQGNVLTPDDEVRQLGGIEIGMPVGADTVAEVTARLRAAGRFERVEVLKRFASIADPTQIVLVVIVDEGPVKIEGGGSPDEPARVVERGGPGLMYLPLLRFEDGYGFTYGVRMTRPDALGRRSRISFPLTWGGEKRAAVELDKEFIQAPVSRIEFGSSITRRRHPFFEDDEDRQRVWVTAERDLASLVSGLRVSGTAGWQHVSFLGRDDGFLSTGAEMVFDTRLDPMLARNAVYTRAAWERSAVDQPDVLGSAGAVNQMIVDARGYLGLVGQSVLVIRALREDSDAPLPPYLKPILGGMPNLRGFRRGTAVGDTLVAGSVELRLPLTSPLNVGKLGVSAFVDVGTVYDNGGRLEDQHLERAVGGAVWFSAAFVRLNLAVAHGIGGSTRVHFGTGVSP
jgi:outer membrane protein assembly factor BamA